MPLREFYRRIIRKLDKYLIIVRVINSQLAGFVRHIKLVNNNNALSVLCQWVSIKLSFDKGLANAAFQIFPWR